MRVRSISVRKLFGRFDHTIPLNLDERITIIHGPNGYGKTALLRLVHAAFDFDVKTLLGSPFQTLRVDLDDGTYLEVAPASTGRDMSYVFGQGEHVMVQDGWSEKTLTGRGGSYRQELYEAARREWSEVPNAGELLKILQEKEPLFGGTIFLRLWLSRISVDLVSVQRLLTPIHLSAYQSQVLHGEWEEGERGAFDQTVLVYSTELRDAIWEAHGDYLDEIQELDLTFPKRLIEAMNEPAPADADIANKLRELDEQRQRLARLGILPGDYPLTEMPKAIADDATRKLLWLYARDVEAKLEVFADLAARAELLQELLNQRFQFKQMRIDAERGFVFESDTGQELPPTELSSGEQHQLVMIFECLFRTDEDALLLIDEPELSLHVSWQVEFLRDLQRIIEIAKFDVLIATHSPQIIHDRWDLTVELQPPSKSPVPATDAPVAGEESALE
jgi:hypothetical protein